MMKKALLLLLGYLVFNTASADLWQDTSLRGSTSIQAQANQVFRFDEARLLSLDVEALHTYLDAALAEETTGSTVTIPLPLPHGEFAEYQLYQSPVLAPELAARYPQIRNFKVIAVDNPAHTGRLDFTPQGFHALLRRGSQTVFIDPIGNNHHYQSYYKSDYAARKVNAADHKPFVCSSGHQAFAERPLAATLLGNSDTRKRAARLSFGSQVKTYRLAIAATGEFTQFHGGTKEKAMSALSIGISRINEVYINDLAIKLEIVDDNDKVIYTNAATDPFGSFDQLVEQSITTINSEIGTDKYDVGHVVGGAGLGGEARIAVICNDTGKAGGATSRNLPINDPFFIDFVAHELGHQFGSEHSFNSRSGSCGVGNRVGSHAYEPGSGSTIMGYAGICAPENLQQNSDAYFHADSIEQIRAHLVNGSGNSCGVVSGSNNLPTVSAGTDQVIPQLTPFALTGSGSDTDGDTLTYTWEQLDLGRSTSSGIIIDNGSSPIFRSFMPTTSPTRTLPQLSDVLNNTTTYGEVLPSTDRELNFRLTVRDGKGGVASDDMKVQVVTAAGPFSVTLPANTHWMHGSQTVTWNVANTTAAPVSCANVKIDLSTNGGTSFPTTLLASTANNGTANVTIPAVTTNTARVRVSCTSQPFFAINSSNITITSDGSGDGNNTAPVAMNDSYSFEQSTNTRQLNVLQNDSDSDGDTLTIVSVSNTGNHAISVASNGKSINFKHNSGFSGTLNFTYTISDGTAEASANVSVTVTTPPPANQVPIANADKYEVEQNSSATTLNLLENDTDPDGDEIRIFRINSISDGGTVVIAANGESVSYTPAKDFVGTETINYAIRDENNENGSANVKVTVIASSDNNGDGGGGSSTPYFLLMLLLLAVIRVGYTRAICKPLYKG